MSLSEFKASNYFSSCSCGDKEKKAPIETGSDKAVVERTVEKNNGRSGLSVDYHGIQIQ